LGTTNTRHPDAKKKQQEKASVEHWRHRYVDSRSMNMVSLFSAVGAAVVALVISLTSLTQDPTAGSDRSPKTGAETHPLARAAKIAIDNGVSKEYVDLLMQDSTTAFDEKYVRTNVTNFATKPDYSHNWSSEAVSNVRDFLMRNKTVLHRADSIHGVPPQIIGALLWVETKHGRFTGKHHVPSVYLSLLLSNEASFVESNTLLVMKNRSIDSSKIDSVRGSVQKRADRKVNWAIQQLKALQSIQQRRTMNTLTLRGSWAGAFGLTQFLPSSYLSSAADGNDDGLIDLYQLDDAVFSVANYLDRAGWGKTPEQQRKAIHHYNNSDDYVNAVMKLAGLASE
jgi:membrane-bound lytic murein transglycosylase B